MGGRKTLVLSIPKFLQLYVYLWLLLPKLYPRLANQETPGEEEV